MTCLLLILVGGTVTLAIVGGHIALALPVTIAAATGLVRALNQSRSDEQPDTPMNAEDGNIERL